MGREQSVSDDLSFKTRVGGPVLKGTWWAVQEPTLSLLQSSLRGHGQFTLQVLSFRRLQGKEGLELLRQQQQQQQQHRISQRDKAMRLKYFGKGERHKVLS